MDKNIKSFIYYVLHAIFVFFAVAASAASIGQGGFYKTAGIVTLIGVAYRLVKHILDENSPYFFKGKDNNNKS